MNRPPPLKRIDALIPLSHDHHHGLWLSLKIRSGFKKGIEPVRIKNYTDWFFEEHMQPHFDLEEKYVFPILGNDHELVKRALAEHRKLNRLFTASSDLQRNLVLIEEMLENHIRFEERILFTEIQCVAAPADLQTITTVHSAQNDHRVSVDSWEDTFWKYEG